MGRPRKDQSAQPNERKQRTPAPEGCRFIRVCASKAYIKALANAGAIPEEHIRELIAADAIRVASKLEQAEAAHRKLMQDLLRMPPPPPAPFVEQPRIVNAIDD